jgi:xylulokinase
LSKDLVLGLDLGTSSIKAILIDQSGAVVKKLEAKLPIRRIENQVEQDCEDYQRALIEITKGCKDFLSRISSMGLSGQTPSLLGIDELGKPTFPTLIWQDNRASKEADELASKFGNPWNLIGTSLPWAASACPAKMLWISREKSEWVKKTRWLLQPKDYLGFLLTGEAISDPWSTKGICNVKSRSAIAELIEFCGWEPKVMPKLQDGFQSRGRVTRSASELTGLPEGLEVSTGWSDAMCGMLALGVFAKPTSFVITGTSAIVGTSSTKAPDDAGALYVIPDSCAPLSVTYGPTQMSGGSIAWAAKLIGASEEDFVALGDSNQSESVPVYLPYIAGERAPLWRSDIRGAFSELSIEDDQSSLARATMEGVAFAERQVLEMSQQISGSNPEEITLGGHAGNDPKWIKARKRTMGRKLRRISDADITCRGSAILAHAIITNNLAESTRALSPKSESYEVDSHEIDYGIRHFERFLAEQRALLAKSKGSR